MTKIYSDMVEINASCADVCAAMTAVSDWSTWRADLVEVTPVRGSAFEAGFAWREVRFIKGSEVQFDVEVTDFANEESVSLIANGGKTGAGSGAVFFEYRLVDYESFTTLHLDSKLDRPGLLRSMLSRSYMRAFLDLYRSDLLRLKAYVEATDRRADQFFSSSTGSR